MFRSFLWFGAVAWVLSVAAAPVALSQQSLPRAASIATNPQGSLHYAVGSIFAKVLSESLPVNFSVRPFTGPTLFVPQLENGEITFGISNLVDGHMFYNGVQPWRHFTGIRLVTPVFRLHGSLIVRADSPIKAVADAKGKRIGADYRAHLISRFTVEAMVANAGLSLADFRQVPVSAFPDGVRALMEDRADIVYGAVGPPIVREAAAALPGGIRFLSLSDAPDAVARMQTPLPGSGIEKVPAGFFIGINEPTNLVTNEVYFVGATKTADELVYAATKTFWEKVEELKGAHAALKARFSREYMVQSDITIPYHRAAIRFFKEQGAWPEAAEKANQALLARQQQKD